MRTAIYARFSTDLQQTRSIDDQVALCRAHAEKAGMTVLSVYADSARSGASMFGRDGLMRMMDAAREKAFDVILVESLDRLSRDQEDLAGIWKRLSFLGIELRAVHDGKADHIQIGIRGLVGALYLQDLAHKVRRGLSGVVRDGRHAGGRAYGYKPVPGQPGMLSIDEEEAAIRLRKLCASSEKASSDGFYKIIRLMPEDRGGDVHHRLRSAAGERAVPESELEAAPSVRAMTIRDVFGD